MDKYDTTNPAFPVHAAVQVGGEHSGMSLRDYFAAKVLVNQPHPFNQREYNLIAEYCYEIADAMLAERKRDIEL